jgi:hypothetical protein
VIRCLDGMRIESSIITSLSELRAIEQQRIADERAAVERERAAHIEAKRAAEQARVDAEQAKLRAEREELMRIEQTRLEAERQARMKVEAAEATERARLQAQLEQQRMAEEMELRRAEIAKKRPRWMIAVTAFALVATVGFGWYAVDSNQRSQVADQKRIEADNAMRVAKEQAAAAKATLDKLATEMKDLDDQVDKAQNLLAVAKTKADREAAAAAIAEANHQRAEIKRQQDEAERKRLAAERAAGFDAKVCTGNSAGSIDCIDGVKPKKHR